MKHIIICPACENEVVADMMNGGVCNSCGNEYYIYEECSEDYSECWPSVEWDQQEYKE